MRLSSLFNYHVNQDSEWAQITFQIPASIDHPIDQTIGESDGALDQANWYFYQYADAKPLSWPSQLATTNREKLKLNIIIQDILIASYLPRGPLIPALKVLQHYEYLLAWKKNLPDIIGNTQGEVPALPHVLSLL